MPTVIGIDPSLTGTALWTTDCQGENAPIRLTNKLTGTARLMHIRDEVSKFIYSVPQPYVVYEDYAFSRSNAAFVQGELGGVLRVLFTELGVPFTVVKPNLRAKFATGKGNAGKDFVVSETSARTGFTFPNNDLCDAFVLWCMGREHLDREHPLRPLPKTHLAALDTIEWPAP